MSEIIITSNSLSTPAAAAPSADLAKDANENEVNSVASENEVEITDESEASDDQDLDNHEDVESNDQKEKQAQKKKSGNGFKKRLSKVQAERDYWREVAMKTQAPSQAVENQPKQEQKEQKPTDGAPNPDDYESYGEFLRDVARYEARQEADSREKQRVEKEKEISAKAEYQKTIESFNSQISEAKKEISDFEDVVSSIDDYEAVPALQEAILTSDIGAKLVYELAKNQKELDRINALNPALIFREIGKLEAKLLKGSESEKQINKKTNAPKPISPIGSSSSKALSKSIYDKDLTFAEYEALRRKQAMAK